MIRNTVLPTVMYYYPLGNTPAVCLTQDLPPEQDADILCLGCGDARNVLFTCFADSARKIDVTCCDIEPGIHARNVLLYSLLIDDKENANIEQIWNIYYHWKFDKKSSELLEAQAQKLLQFSESMDKWRGSVYGSCIRFCDLRSLSLVRSHWNGFQLRGLSPVKTKQRLSQLQGAINGVKAQRKQMTPSNHLEMTGLRSSSPVGLDAIFDLAEVSKQWWECGTVLSTLKATDLNPAFLYLPNQALSLHYGISPLMGFPLSTAYVPIAEKSPFCLKRHKSKLSTEHLVDCAKIHFAQWASAFRRAVKNKSVIRIFCGDALAFGCTLRNCQLTGATSMNLFCDTSVSSPLVLCEDYGNVKKAAPMSFDVVDTSNLADHLGPLNVICVTSSLLKYKSSSSLYMEMLVQHDSSVGNRFSDLFGVDARTLSLLLELVLPELFTNATDSPEDDSVVDEITKMMGGVKQPTTQARSRLRWKRLQGCEESCDTPHIHVEAKMLAKLLIQVHNAMFAHEDPAVTYSMPDPSALLTALAKQANICYNRASFAFLLNVLKATVISDWNQCVQDVYNHCFSFDSLSSDKLKFAQDVLVNFYIFGVDNGMYFKAPPVELSEAVLAPILPAGEDMPDALCVTIRVSRDKLKVFTDQKFDIIGTPVLICSFQGGDPGKTPWLNLFSAVQITFGTWRAQTNKDSCPCIVEDSSQLSGTSDMFASVMVPTWMLLQSRVSVPLAKCGLMVTAQNVRKFLEDFGPDLCFARSKMTSDDVFITHFMPGMTALPTFPRQDKSKPTSATTTVRLTSDGSKINTVIRQFPLNSQAKLTDKVKVKFRSPLSAVVNVTKSTKLKLNFPLPLSPTKHKVRFPKKSSLIEVESTLFNPLNEDVSSFMLPTLITKGSAVPTLWTSTRIDLDAMPSVNLNDTKAISWLSSHTSLMFSTREHNIFKRDRSQVDAQADVKDRLFSLFMHFTGVQGLQTDVFGLMKMDGGLQIIIFPSCLRLDLVNHTVVLDVAMIPLVDAMMSDQKAMRFLEQQLQSFWQMKVEESTSRAWKATMPAWVERCRTWKHAHGCEYVSAGEAPLPKALSGDGVSPICSCGVGKFPSRDYLQNLAKRFPELNHMLSRYASRAALGPIFPVPYVEPCFLSGLLNSKLEACSIGLKEKCAKCDESKQGLLLCSRCRMVKYCSKKCQKSDWKEHKLLCKAA